VTDYIVNPRRAPRAPSRCRAKVQAQGQSWEAETEDIGPHGCQLVAPAPLPKGTALQLAVLAPGAREALRLTGRVAWVGSQPPWRLGISFDEAARPSATRWFEALVAGNPGLGNFRRVPDRLPVDAMVFLALPPRFADFTKDELEVLRHVAGGATIAALRTRLVERWPALQRILFALLSRGLLTVSRGAAAHPESWRLVMAEYETSFVTDGPAGMAPPSLTWIPPAAPVRTAPPGAPLPPLPPPFQPPIQASVQAPLQAPVPPQAAPAPTSQPAAVEGGEATAGTGWRGATRRRTADAQEAFDLGRAEAEVGRSKAAMALLRRALQLSPGDAEIAAELGKLMKG
jgi:hypothetical protein